MPRGGYRKNAGRKAKWEHGKTTSIRVPEVLVDQILELAHKIDQRELEKDTNSNNIIFYDVPLINVNGKIAVFLTELLKAGYEIKPLKLAEMLREEYLRETNESKKS